MKPTLAQATAPDTTQAQDDESTPDWHAFWLEGTRYLEIVQKAFPGKATFTPEILYHMTGMAIEKMFMAWLGHNKNLPDNHLVRDLARAAELLEALPPELYKELRRFDRFMGLCSLEPAPMPPPTAADVPGFIKTAEHARDWIAARYDKA